MIYNVSMIFILFYVYMENQLGGNYAVKALVIYYPKFPFISAKDVWSVSQLHKFPKLGKTPINWFFRWKTILYTGK